MASAEAIKLESDERGFELHILVDEEPQVDAGGWLTINIHVVAPELFEQVKRQIGSWLAEGEAARQEYHRAQRASGLHPITEEDLDGYDLNDPKRVELLRILDGGGWA